MSEREREGERVNVRFFGQFKPVVGKSWKVDTANM